MSQEKAIESKEEINKLLANADFVNMIRDYLDKKGVKESLSKEIIKPNNNPEIKERIIPNNKNQENREEKKDEINIDINTNIMNQEKIDELNKDLSKQTEEDLDPSLKKDYQNMLHTFGINNAQTPNNNTEQKNDLINSNNKDKDKDKDTTVNYRSSSPSRNSVSNTSSSGGDPRKYLGRKRFDDEYICKQIYEDKHSSPSLILMSKIIEEFSFSVVLDTLLKNSLSQNLKLDSLLQGLIDAEGINKVILMLLKFRT
jgi:hypothetical protein